MKLVLDMNLSPSWVSVFESRGWEAVHWSEVGDFRASDREIMSWAREQGCVVLTHDLDFGALLAASSHSAPSVVQIRVRDILPGAHTDMLCEALERFENHLQSGVLLIIEPNRERVRILPLTGNDRD